MDDLKRLLPGYYYHVYNRGNNKETLFPEHGNYLYFLQLWKQHIHPVAETFAYALLKNHFHALICIRPLNDLLQVEHFSCQNNDVHFVSNQLSRCFANFFNAYAKAINKRFNRTGSLFQERYRRKVLLEDEYLTTAVLYIHSNAQKHGFVGNGVVYPYCSFQSVLSEKPSLLQRSKVLQLFGGTANFIAAHDQYCESVEARKQIFERECDDEC